MKTLHIYHWHNQQTLTTNLPLLDEQDSLVIYGSLTADDISFLTDQMQGRPQQWYLVKDNNDPITGGHEISETHWVQLIEQHHNTWAWK